MYEVNVCMHRCVDECMKRRQVGKKEGGREGGRKGQMQCVGESADTSCMSQANCMHAAS